VSCNSLGHSVVLGWACFASADAFYTSGVAAMTGYYGEIVKDALAAGKSNGEVAQIMADQGYAPNTPTYGKNFQGASDVLKAVSDCP
jgi:hypothetical protein